MSVEQFEIVTESDHESGESAISPEEYREVLSGLALFNIGVDRVHAEVTNRMAMEAATQLVPEFKSSCEFQSLKGSDLYINVVLQHASLVIGDGQMAFFSMQLTFQLDYASKKPFTKRFFQEFKQGPLVAQITPFIREYIHSTMSRMSVPPFLLPLIQVDIAAHSEDGPTAETQK